MVLFDLQDPSLAQWGIVLGAALWAAWMDLRTRKIPNRLTGPVLLTGLLFSTFVSGWAGLAGAMTGCLIMMVPFILLFIFAGGGAGDAKLMGALGTWLGAGAGLTALICVTLTGGVMAIGWAIYKGQAGPALGNLIRMTQRLAFVVPMLRSHVSPEGIIRQEGLAMPYGPAIFIGVCIAAGVTLCG